MSTKATPVTRGRGRPLLQNSIRRSAAIVKYRFVQSMTLQAIADKLNAKDGQHFTPQAVRARILGFAKKFPAEYAAIVGSVQVAPVALEATAAPVDALVAA